MKKLALAAFALAGLTQATGCIFTSDDTSGGQFTYSWTVTGSACQPTWKVSFVATPSAGQAFDDIYTCSDMTHDSPTYALDSYVISPTLFDDVDGVTSTTTDDVTIDQPAALNATLDTKNQILPLPTVAFVATPPNQDVDFSVDYGTAGGGKNCDSTTATPPGNGVVQQEIDIFDQGGAQCLNTFAITGTDQTGMPINDTTCGMGLCNDQQVIQTIKALPNGNYTIGIIGFKSATDASLHNCYNASVDFTVPVANHDLGIIVAPFNPIGMVDMAACNATKPGEGR